MTSVRTSDEGDYDVVVTGLCGSVVSATARLVVICTPTIPQLVMQLTREVGREHSLTHSRDACVVGKILRALNGDGLTSLCNRTGGAILFTGCN